MSNNLFIGAYNLINDPNVVLSASSETAGFPVTNLRDPRLSRKWKATGITSEWIKLDCSAVVASLKQATHLFITTTNMTINADITVEADTTDDFSTPTVSLAKSLVLDPDTDPTTWGETMIASIPYKTHCFVLGQDILASNDWIRIVFADTDNDDVIRIAKIFIGWGVQWSINYNLGQGQSFDSHTSFMRSSAYGFHQTSRATFDRLTLAFPISPTADHVKAKYVAEQFGTTQPMWIALDPDHDAVAYSRDGMRVHGASYYGHGRIPTFQEPIAGILSYGLQFEEDVTSPFSEALAQSIGVETPAETPTLPPEYVLVDLGNRNSDLGVVPSAETLKSSGSFVELGGCRKCLFLTGNIVDTNSGELAVVYKFNSSDSVYYPLDGTDGPKISLGSLGGTHSGWRDIAPAAYAVAGVYIYYLARGGDDADTGGAGRLILQLAEAAP